MGCAGGKHNEANAYVRRNAHQKDGPTLRRLVRLCDQAEDTFPSESSVRKCLDARATVKLDSKQRLVMTRYRMATGQQSVMGQGTFSICRKGVDVVTNQPVAIKVYKEQQDSKGNSTEVMMHKFRRQVEVLTELQEPFEQNADSALWHDVLSTVEPADLFTVLMDYSKHDEKPDADPEDGIPYLVTDLAQYNLSQFLRWRRSHISPMLEEDIKSVSRAIILVVAGLHAKGFVHLDLKPENLMLFRSRLKLIDLDGCMRQGVVLSPSDSTLSFSPLYCAPEFASFVVTMPDAKHEVTTDTAMDVWSVGMTLCELVTLNCVMRPKYNEFRHKASSQKNACWLLLQWLTGVQIAPLPEDLELVDPQFAKLMKEHLLVVDKSKRGSCAQALDNPFIAAASELKVATAPDSSWFNVGSHLHLRTSPP